MKDKKELTASDLRIISKDYSKHIFGEIKDRIVGYLNSEEYSEFFGFTENDVIEALKYFNIEYELPEVKSWYDGYRFGNSELYNPWSILNFLQSKELEPYWVGTSENFLIKNVLKEATTDTNDILENLFNGEDVEEVISGTSDLSILMDSKEVWELLLFSGYLTVKEKIDSDIYSLRLPNKEIKNLFKKEFINFQIWILLFRRVAHPYVRLFE